MIICRSSRVMSSVFLVLYIGLVCVIVLFLNDTATTEIYTYCHTLSLHDALPIWSSRRVWSATLWTLSGSTLRNPCQPRRKPVTSQPRSSAERDRKSTRLNSSH